MKKPTALFVGYAIVGCGVAVIADEVVYLAKFNEATSGAVTTISNKASKETCERKDFLGQSVDYNAGNGLFGIWSFASAHMALDTRSAGSLVVQEIDVKPTTHITSGHVDTDKESSEITIIAVNPQTGRRVSVTNPSPSFKCVKALIAG